MGDPNAGSLFLARLPNYAVIGVTAPMLLVVLRFIQGFGVGGEWGGAVLMSVEHAPPNRRTLYGSFPQMGLPAGIILANLLFLSLDLGLPPADFAAWGWRIPFLSSAVLIALGLWLRLRVAETPTFEDLKANAATAERPLVGVFRQAPRELLCASAASIAAPALGYLVLVYMLSYGTTILKLPETQMLWLIIAGSVVWLVAIPSSALLADRIGRKPVFLMGAALVTLWALPFFRLVDTGSVPQMLLAFAVGTVGIAAMAGPQAALAAGLFSAQVRYTGASIAYQVGSVLGGALAPIIATALYARTGSSQSIALYMAALGLISTLALAFLRQSRYAQTATPVAAPMSLTQARQAHLSSSRRQGEVLP